MQERSNKPEGADDYPETYEGVRAHILEYFGGTEGGVGSARVAAFCDYDDHLEAAGNWMHRLKEASEAKEKGVVDEEAQSRLRIAEHELAALTTRINYESSRNPGYAEAYRHVDNIREDLYYALSAQIKAENENLTQGEVDVKTGNEWGMELHGIRRELLGISS